MFNFSRDSVLTYNKKFWKVPLKKKISEEQIELAKQMILDGKTYSDIADALGFKTSTIADRNNTQWHLPYSSIQSAKKMVPRSCKTCGKVFYVRQQKLKHDACDYCSKKCSHIGAIKPDKIMKPIFRGYKWAYLSLGLRKRIPFCQRCLVVKKRLTVHHIKPWRLQGTNVEQNLLVLCDSCHRYLETASRDMFEIMGIDNTVLLIQAIYKRRMEKINWIYTRLNLQKLGI